MALVPKSAVIQIRLDPDLLAEFQRVCDSNHVTVSHQLRDWMYRFVADFAARQKRLEARSASPVAVPAPESFQLEKTPPDPVKTLPVVKSKAKLKAERKRGK